MVLSADSPAVKNVSRIFQQTFNEAVPKMFIMSKTFSVLSSGPQVSSKTETPKLSASLMTGDKISFNLFVEGNSENLSTTPETEASEAYSTYFMITEPSVPLQICSGQVSTGIDICLFTSFLFASAVTDGLKILSECTATSCTASEISTPSKL